MQVLLDEQRGYFKAALHGHSRYSDGAYSVEELKDHFKAHGYSIVAFTDHEHLIDNSRLDDPDFLTITASELAIKEFPEQSTLVNYDMRVSHLNIYALDQHNDITPCYSSVYDHYVTDENRPLIRYEGEYERVYSAEGINEIIATANQKGFLVAYNHPGWSLENARDYLQYEGLFAVELYNYSCVMAGIDYCCVNILDDFWRDGKPVWGTFCDDNHTIHSHSAFGGWVMLNSRRLDYAEVMDDLKSGRFYSSAGPEIYSLVREDNLVTIRTSAARQICLTTRGRRTEARHGDEAPLTEATFTLKPTDGYFRITVTDAEGKRAITQVYPL